MNLKEKNLKSLTVRLPNETYNSLKQISENTSIAVTSLIIMAIISYFSSAFKKSLLAEK